MQRFPAAESSYWDTSLLGSHPLGSLTTPFLTITKIEWRSRACGQVLKLTFAENIKNGNSILSTMHFLRLAENACRKSIGEAFFYFVSKLNQPVQIPIARTRLDEQKLIYWVLGDEVIEEIKIERDKWTSLGYNDIAEYCQENKALVEQEIKKPIDAQEWLDKTYHHELKKQIKQLDLRHKGLAGNLDLIDFINLEGLNCSSNYLTDLNLWGLTNLKSVDCGKNNLNSLNLKDCANLEWLACSHNQFAQLNLAGCYQLTNLYCANNLLANLDFFTGWVKNRLIWLNLSNNNFSHDCDLTPLAGLANLKNLYLGSHDQRRINQGTCNRFTGSLKPLQKMTKLEELTIDNTDLDSGLEYLSDSIEKFSCLADKRKDAKVQNISNLLANEWGTIETDRWGYVENLPQKLQTYKKRLRKQKVKARKLLENEFQTHEQQIQKLTEQLAMLNQSQRFQIKTNKINTAQGHVPIGNTFGDYADLSITVNNNYRQEKNLITEINDLKQKLSQKEKQVINPFLEKKELTREIGELKQELTRKELELTQLRQKNVDLLNQLLAIKEKELEAIILAVENGEVKLARKIAEKQKEIDDLENQLVKEQKKFSGVKVMLDEFIQNKNQQGKLQTKILRWEQTNVQAWTHHYFTLQQAQEWININPPVQQEQAAQEPEFYAWLRDTKNLTPEQVLNYHNLNSLRQEFQSQQQAYIQQTNLPPNN